MNRLRSCLEEGEFLHSIELVLGRDHSQPEVAALLDEASRTRQGPKIISVTDLPAGSPALAATAVVDEVMGHGLTPLAHITGRDSNRAGLESRLHELAKRGVENLLALTGDLPRDAYRGRSRGVFDLDSVQILDLIRAISNGLEYSKGKKRLCTRPFPFLPGAVVNPFKMREADQMMQLYKLELKLSVGARFLITQLGYNLRKLYELRQYLCNLGMNHVPIVANVYILTPGVAGMIAQGKLPGCHLTEKQRGEFERMNARERLERGALLLAAVRELGFQGAHLGGFGLKYREFMRLVDRSLEIGAGWRSRIEELLADESGGFYLFSQRTDGLSDPSLPTERKDRGTRPQLRQRISRLCHESLIQEESLIGNRLAHYFSNPSNRDGGRAFLSILLAPAGLYRRLLMGCRDCGDCVQDHLEYAGCPVRECAKGLRNGPCGGSRPDGSCEAEGASECLWNRTYRHCLRYHVDPVRYRRVLVPPRDWHLDGTNALVNRFAGTDNFKKRVLFDRKPIGNGKNPAVERNCPQKGGGE